MSSESPLNIPWFLPMAERDAQPPAHDSAHPRGRIAPIGGIVGYAHHPKPAQS